MLAAFEDLKVTYSTPLGKVWFRVENTARLFYQIMLFNALYLIVAFNIKLFSPYIVKPFESGIKHNDNSVADKLYTCVFADIDTGVFADIEMKTLGIAVMAVLVVTFILNIVGSRASFQRELFQKIVNVRQYYTFRELLIGISEGMFFPRLAHRRILSKEMLVKAAAFFCNAGTNHTVWPCDRGECSNRAISRAGIGGLSK
jgi:hypothetical protein